MSDAVVLNPQQFALPAALAATIDDIRSTWTREKKVAALWKKDARLWTNSDEGRWLGWLDAPERARELVPELTAFADEIHREGFTHALLLGMGGSSLAPEVLRLSFGRLGSAPDFAILDSTDPAQVLAAEARCDLARTLVIVASKSGSTLEPNVFLQYIHARLRDTVGDARAARQMVAITDPGSKMQQVAEREHFRHVFFGDPSIGGRYSALSPFGLVPAAVMGIDVARFLSHAQAMAAACRRDDAADNPGVALGVLLGAAAAAGRDKLTITTSPGIFDLGAWLEQLIAESTGKLGKAIIPVDLEGRMPPGHYGADRVFVSLTTESDTDEARSAWLGAIEAAGHPVIRIRVSDGAYGLAQEFFRWEVATAVAGAVMGLHPFDQPDVEAAKIATRAITSAYETTGALPAESPLFAADGLAFYADAANAAALTAACGRDVSARRLLDAHVARVDAGDYVALLAYLEMNARNSGVVADIRGAIAHRTKAATCVGFGPRFLHSTGQAYKGGGHNGVFLQFTADDARDVQVPGQRFTFGVVKAAQALGDLQVLNERGRRALRVHLGADVAAGLAQVLRLLA